MRMLPCCLALILSSFASALVPVKPASGPIPVKVVVVAMFEVGADTGDATIQAILAGRADTYVNDVNTVDNAVKANPDRLEKALAVTIPYSVGIAVPKGVGKR